MPTLWNKNQVNHISGGHGDGKMKKLILLAMVLGLFTVSGCAITSNYTLHDSNVNFTNFKTVQVKIVDKVNTDYSKEGIVEFESTLKAHLEKTPLSVGRFGGMTIKKGLGYCVVNQDEDLLIQIDVIYFKPDNKALRIIVGMGSGKGGLKYVAKFSSKGKPLATLEGGKSYGDVNIFGDSESTIYRGGESTKSFMILHSVVEIGNFLRGEMMTEKVQIQSELKSSSMDKEELFLVYDLNFSNYYHRIGCPVTRYATYKTKLTKEQAEALGLKPCSVCIGRKK
jgi:hypothetical protein